MNAVIKKKWQEIFLTLPSFAWLTIFFLLPTIIIFCIAFKPASFDGTVGNGWTWRTLLSLRNPNYPEIIWRTLWLSISTTVISIAVSIPIAYYIARCTPWKRNLVLFLTIIPFWTSFLIRIFAWKGVLHPDGFLKHLLVFCHIISEDTMLLYRPEAVLLVMIYTELPFAILPLYAAAEKFDFTLIEAAMDLGAGRLRAFMSVFIPGIKSGLLSACLMVLIPSFGSYVVPDVVGGLGSEMIGNVIVQRTFTDRNLPAASALASVLIIAMLIPLLYFLKGKKHGKNEPEPAKEVV